MVIIMIKNKLFTTIICVCLILFTITFSIALPIFVRPFYYAHIDAYNLEAVTGKSREQIITAYDQVLDYLTMPDKEFGAGDFAYSEEGKSHFEDCKGLFTLNNSVLIISVILIVLLLILKRKGVFDFSRPFRKHFTFLSGALTLFIFALIGGLCAIDFNKAFVIFHKVFFYGKDNWIFDYRTDEIIAALPQQFFLNCGILIVSSIIVISIIFIIYGIFSKKKN